MEYCLASRGPASYISALLETQAYIEVYRRRIREARVSTQQRAEQAREAALGCAQKRVEEFGTTRVYLFGSIAEGRFRLASDIDLVAEGLAPEKFFMAAAAISRFARDFDVDLILFETHNYQVKLLKRAGFFMNVIVSKSLHRLNAALMQARIDLKFEGIPKVFHCNAFRKN